MILDWLGLYFITLRQMSSQNMSLQDGIELLSFFLAQTIILPLLICGVLDASLLKCCKENLSFLELTLKIKFNSFVSIWALQTSKI